jgi:uncharacterized glyoxalase superfamily protein PhnB
VYEDLQLDDTVLGPIGGSAVRLEALTPILRTWNIDATINFYAGTLGFVCDNQADGWASLSRQGIGLMLASPNHHERDRSPSFTGSLYFRVDDVDGFWLEVKDFVTVCYGIETFDYGMREFAIYDNNGYVLQFGQPSPKAP